MSNVNFVALEQLELKLAVAQNMQLSDGRVQEALNAVIVVKEQKNSVCSVSFFLFFFLCEKEFSFFLFKCNLQ